MVISQKGIGRMSQNLAWHSFSTDPSCVANYKKIRRGHVNFMLIWYGMTLLLSAVHDWAKSLDDHLSTHCVFIDFAKAFDSVPHARLLAKLQVFGVQGSMLQWFRSFLTTHQQRVVINDQHFEWHDVSSGVPQGSILGPLLFIFYINDISSVTKSKLKIFADDVTLFTSVKCKEDCLSLQADLDAISRWCHLWQMKLHPLKCKVLCISNKRSPLQNK